MRKYVLILMLFLAGSLHGLSQHYVALLNIDSLKKVLPVAKDTQRINTLNLISLHILFTDKSKGCLDRAETYTQEALVLSKALNYDKGVGNALWNKGIISIEKRDNFNKTLASLQIALGLLKRSNDGFSVAGCFSNIGDCYHYLGENNTAITFFDSSQFLFQQLHDTISSIWVMINKGHSYYDLGNYDGAFKTFRAAQELTPKNDTMLQCFAIIQLAKLFLGANLPEITIDYIKKVRNYYLPVYDQQPGSVTWPLSWGLLVSGEAFVRLNMIDSAFKIAQILNISLKDQDSDDNLFYGHVYAGLHQYEKALVYFKNGYRLSLTSFHEIALARHALELARTYLNIRSFSQANAYANESLSISEKIHALLEKKNAVGILTDIYHQTKQYKKAYQYNQLYKSLSDSLSSEEYRRKLSLLQVQQELDNQKQQAQLLGKEKLINQQQINLQQVQLNRKSLLLYIFIGAMVVGLVLIMLVIRNLKLKKRKEQLQQLIKEADSLLEQKRNEQQVAALEKEKADLEMSALRAQMNPHFIFNCLSSINRFILINKTEEASDYLTKFSRLIRMTLHNSEKSFITLENELDALGLYLDLERLRFKNAFDYSITFINTIDISAVFIPPLLIQPFAENAIWHGLMHKEGTGNLDIALEVEEKMLICTITDDGIGRTEAARLKSKSAEKNKAMGIQITAERLALLNRVEHGRPTFNVVDIVDSEGHPCGTKVVLQMEYKDLIEVDKP